MQGLRKVLMTIGTLVLETGVFITVIAITKMVDGGMLTAYFTAVVTTLGIFTAGNAVAKFVAPPTSVQEPPKA